TQCPQCKSKIPYRAALRTGSVAGIICPICKVGLAPKVWTNAVVLAVASSVGTAAADVLRSSGFGWFIRLVTFTLTFAVASWAGWIWVVRLRLRSDNSRPLGL